MHLFNFVCVKYGDKYSAEYVNNLYLGIKKHFSLPFTLHCITDDPTGIYVEVKKHILPDEKLDGWWWKVSLFNPSFYPDLQGEVLYLDLDVVIVDSITPFISLVRNADLLTMKDPWHNTMNSSVMRWNRSELGWVWERFKQTDYTKYAGDQNFLNEVVVNKSYFPDEWILGWKAHGKERVIEKQPKIVIFNGKPDPHELVKEVGWIAENWGKE